jgi:Ca2+-binding EF-hand superfamily protein
LRLTLCWLIGDFSGMYYSHKKYSIEKNQRNELIKKFDNHDIAGLGRINPKDARSILLTCGFSLDEALQIVTAADSEQRNNIRKEAFLEEIRLHLVNDTIKFRDGPRMK